MKKATQSKTIRVGSFYISAAVLLAALQMFGQLEMVMSPMISADSAIGWGSIGLAVIGGIQIWLRIVTSEPIGRNGNTAG
jgi:L-asparagine transporter-like permease